MKRDGGVKDSGVVRKKRKRDRGLFDPPEEGRIPIEIHHGEEAFSRLQRRETRGER